MAIVGTAYIATKVISNNLSKDFKSAVENSTKDLGPEFQKMGEKLGADLGDGIGREVDRSVKKSIVQTTTDVDRDGQVKSAFQRMGTSLSEMFHKAFTDENKKGLGEGFGAAMAVAKPMFIAGLGALLAVGLQVVNAWVGQASALISVIGSALAGVSLALAGSITAVGLAGIAVLLAFKTESPVLDRFKEVAAAVGQEFKAIGLAVQQELLPRLGEAMVLLTGTIPVLKEGMAGIGEAVGKTAIKFAEMVTEAENLERLRIILDYSKTAAEDFGTATVNLGQSALILLAAAKPLTLEFANWTKELTAGWAASLKVAEANGSLAAFFDRAGERAKALGRIIRDLTVGLFNFFAIGAETGDSLLARIEVLAARFRAWTESVEGENAIRDWFVQADRVGKEFAGLLGDIGRAFGEMIKQNPDVAIEFIRALRDAVPALVGALPGIVALVGAFAQIIAALAESGVLGLMTGLFTALFQALAFLMDLPLVGWFVSLAVAMAPIAAFFAKFLGIMPVLNALWTALQVVVVSVGIAFGVSIGWAIAIIAAFIALVGAVIWVVKNWDMLKEKTLEVWENITEFIGDAVDKIKEWFVNLGNGLDDLGQWFSDTWKSITDGVKKATDAIVAFFQPVIDFFTNVFKTVMGIFQTWWTLLFTILMLPVKIFVGGVLLAWDWITDKFAEAWAWISSWVSEKWNQLVELIAEPLRKAKDKVLTAWNDTKAAFSSAWTWVTTWISSKWDALKDKLAQPVEEAKRRINEAWQAIKDKANAIWGSLGDGLSSAVSKIKGAINGIIDKLNGLVRGFNTVISGVNKLPGPDLPSIPYIPRLAKGGVVSPSGGGTLAVIAEAGRKERVEPLDENGLSKRDKVLIQSLGGGTANVRVYIGERELTEIVRVEQERGNYALSRSLNAGRRS